MQNLFQSIQLVGEGYDGPENPPIDVHDHKLLSWLLERHKISQKWQAEVKAVKEKVATAVANLPADEEIARLLENNSEVHYFVCKRIFELLEKIEPQDKNLFGQYTSPRMKAWQEIIKAYESGAAYLGEAIQLLVSSVKYEIPATKRRLERCKKLIEDSTKKEAEQEKSAKEYMTKFKKNCEALGIAGDDVQTELEGLVSVLPILFESTVAKVRETDLIEKACAFYYTFVDYSYAAKEGCHRPQQSDVCPTLMYVYKNGNVTVKEMLGLNIAEETAKDGKEKEAELTIDWSSIEAEPTGDAGAGGITIDWGDMSGIEVSGGDAGGAASPAIDWGDAPSQTSEGGAPAINWDIEVEEEGGGEVAEIEMLDEKKEKGGESNPQDNIPAEFKNANLSETILENAVVRNRFLDDVFELEAFLKQRLVEMGAETNTMGNPIQQSAPPLIQQTSIEAVKGYLATVQAIVALLNDKKLRQVLDIKISKKLCVRLAASINQNRSVSNSLRGAKVETERRREELQEQLKHTYPRLQRLVENTKALKKDIEAAASNLFNKRVINIIGEVNTI